MIPPIAHLFARHLIKGAYTEAAPEPSAEGLAELADEFAAEARGRLGRSLAIREVDAGSCNACELELHAVNNRCTIWNASASSSWPARATPTCCWSAAR